MSVWRNRIVETRMVKAADLQSHPDNPRRHPQTQVDVMHGLLDQVGIVDSLIVYRSERYGGLVVIDGHLRKDLGGEWPCEITDLTDEEADLVLATYHPTGDLATMDSEALAALLGRVEMSPVEDASIKELLVRLGEEAAELEMTKLKPAPAKGNKRGTYGAIVKLVMVAEEVGDLERALAATQLDNRAQAILEISRFYLESHAKGQQYTAAEGFAAAQLTGGA